MNRKRKIELLPLLVESIVNDNADVYLLFVDLCGSTQYKQNCIAHRQPDLTWIVRQIFFLQRAAELITKYEGVVVKTVGDELFAYFEATTNAEDVLRCAIEIVQGFENLKAYQGDSRIEAKISLDVGFTYNGSIGNSKIYDPIGSAVDRCARLNSIAKNNEIVFSADFLSSAQSKLPNGKLKAKYGYKTRLEKLKGFGETRCFSILAK